jgi:hypothetical protein
MNGVSGMPPLSALFRHSGLGVVGASATSPARARPRVTRPRYTSRDMVRWGTSTKTSRANPRIMRPPPTTPSIPTPGPAPVKAKLLEGAVTTLAAEGGFPPPPRSAGAVVVGPAGGTVVVVEPPPATAITGAMGLPVGVELVTPEGVTESLAYVEQVSDRALPPNDSDMLVAESS